MNKHGFTLVELLTVIVLIGIISSVAVISYSNFIGNSRDRVYETYMDTLHAETAMYLLSNPSLIPLDNETNIFYLRENIGQNINYSQINNPDDNSDFCTGSSDDTDSFVEVKRKDGDSMISLTYIVHLKCKEFTKIKEYKN